MEKAKRLDWIDMCRGFIMILVVFGHTLTYNSNLRFIIFTFHMPALFIISGYVFKPRPLKTSGPKYAKRLLLPLYAAGFALIIYRIIRVNFETGRISDIVYWVKRTFIAMLFASGTDTPKGFTWVHTFGMLWFLAAMFWAMIFLCLIFNHAKKESVRALLCFAGTIIGIVISRKYWLPMNIDIALIVLTYLYVGHFLKNIDLDNKKIMIPLMVVCIVIWGINYALVGKIELAQRKFTIPVLSFAASVAGSLIVIYAAKLVYRDIKVYNPLCFIGRNSMTVLVLHFIESNMISWNVILPGNPASKKRIILLFILRMIFILVSLTIWTKIKEAFKNWKRK